MPRFGRAAIDSPRKVLIQINREVEDDSRKRSSDHAQVAVMAIVQNAATSYVREKTMTKGTMLPRPRRRIQIGNGTCRGAVRFTNKTAKMNAHAAKTAAPN